MRSRAAALRIGLETYEIERPCREGHYAERDTETTLCLRCRLVPVKIHYARASTRFDMRLGDMRAFAERARSLCVARGLPAPPPFVKRRASSNRAGLYEITIDPADLPALLVGDRTL